MIPYGRQHIDASDIQAVVDVLHSDFLTQGPAVVRFEAAVAQQVGARHAVAVSNGTAALHLACMALGLGRNDTLWTSPISFVASANCGHYCGAKVDFVDIDPVTYNLCPHRLAAKLEVAKRQRRLPKVLIAVHLTGQPCAMAAIRDLALTYDVRVIEDACHALGACYREAPIGNGRFSDITVFSFHPVKLITTGEGGMAVTNDPQLAQAMARLRSHGITREAGEMTEPPHGPWYYQQLALGFNYRMTDLQAALGLSQLSRLNPWVERRRQLAARYDRLLCDLPLTLPFQHPDGQSAFHLYVVRLHPQPGEPSHRTVFERLRAEGVGVNLHYIPIYRQPYHARQGYDPAHFPEAERYYSEAITLPLYPDLSDVMQEEVVAALHRAVEK